MKEQTPNTGNIATKDGDSFVKPCTITHWYRFDPNCPTFDQLRAIEADNKRRIFQTRKRGVCDSIIACLQKLVFW